MQTVTLRRAPDGRITTGGDAYASFGHVLAANASDGIHASWRWDSQTLDLRTDRYGVFPLFAWTDRDGCSIAADLDQLLALGAPRTLDYDALSVFLRVGFFLDGDTPFAAIRALPPHPRIDWTADGLRITGTRVAPRRLDLSRRAAVDAYIDLFAAAMRRRAADGPFEMPLSGGRDSRHILFELARAGRPPTGCVTVEHFPPRGNDDIHIAAALCRRLRIRHVVIPQPGDRVAVEREKNRRTHFCTEEHAQFVVLAEYLRGATRVTYDGIGGDVLSQSSYLRPEVVALFDAGDHDGVAQFILEGYGTAVSEHALKRLLAPALLALMPRERALARLVREVRRHMEAPNPVESFFFWNRTRREIALSPYALMRDLTVYAPYLDYALFDLLAGLPAEMELPGTLHTEAIARAYPEHADVPYEAKVRRNEQPSAQRRLAVALARAVIASTGTLSAAGLLPGLSATLVDGSAARLWHAPLALYLSQLTSAAGAVAPRTPRA